MLFDFDVPVLFSDRSELLLPLARNNDLLDCCLRLVFAPVFVICRSAFSASSSELLSGIVDFGSNDVGISIILMGGALED
jgi:hypothetical protein